VLGRVGGLVLSDASTTVKGIVELATDAETITGTDPARAVTPAGLAASLTAKLDPGVPTVEVQWQTNATSTATGVQIAIGFGRIQGVATEVRDGSFTFPAAYEGVPVALVGMIGGRNNGGTPGTFDVTGLIHVSGKDIFVLDGTSTTGADLKLSRTDGRNINASWEYYFSFVVFGVLA